MDVTKLVDILNCHKCRVRIKVKRELMPESWGTNIGMPVPGYVEVNGPWTLSEVNWLEIDPIIFEHVGRLVPSRRVDSSEVIVTELREQNIHYTVLAEIIKIEF